MSIMLCFKHDDFKFKKPPVSMVFTKIFQRVRVLKAVCMCTYQTCCDMFSLSYFLSIAPLHSKISIMNMQKYLHYCATLLWDFSWIPNIDFRHRRHQGVETAHICAQDALQQITLLFVFLHWITWEISNRGRVFSDILHKIHFFVRIMWLIKIPPSKG